MATTTKQLWAHIFNQEVVNERYRLPLYRNVFEELGARQLEAWTCSALNIHRNYIDTADTEVSRIDNLGCITWVNLVRGRWCFVACSDITQSRLILIDLDQDGDYKTQAFFAGPIMDGQSYDSGSNIEFALTVGTR